MKNIFKLYAALLLAGWGTMAQAQQTFSVGYQAYMEKVTTGNIEYAAERLNLKLSDAEVIAAKVFNDPTLAVSYYNNDERNMEMGYGAEIELSKTFTFGKRKAGIDLAKSEKDLTEALLADYFRNLRAYATLSYLEALKQRMIPREFMLNNLVATALDNRADLVAALKNKEVAARALTLVRRERNLEIDLSLSANFNARVDNEIAPAPSFTGYAAGIAIPLKFSNLNKGNIKAAQIRQQQAEFQYQQVELQIQTEVTQSFHRYQSSAIQAKRYEDKLLDDARRVIDGKIFSYNRGEASLLEVLDAQRTYNEVQAQYIETLCNHIAALVELERDAGIWDIEL